MSEWDAHVPGAALDAFPQAKRVYKNVYALDANLVDEWASLDHTYINDFTEASQDAVGAALTDTTTIDTTYNDGANTMTFDVKKALDHTYITDFDEAAQDAVGGIIIDSGTIDFTYDDAVPSITGFVKAKSLDTSHLADFAKAELAAGQQLTSNSTVFQNITGMALALAANEVWRFHMTLIYISTVAADFKWQFTVPAGATLFYSSGPFNFGAAQIFLASYGAATPAAADGNAANVAIELYGTVINGANAGNLQLQAAQNTGTVEITDFVVQGTNYEARRVSP